MPEIDIKERIQKLQVNSNHLEKLLNLHKTLSSFRAEVNQANNQYVNILYDDNKLGGFKLDLLYRKNLPEDLVESLNQGLQIILAPYIKEIEQEINKEYAKFKEVKGEID